MNIIFQIDGGIGKNIMATAVCKAIKRHYPDDKLIVVAGYPEVFVNNPNVDRCLHFGGTHYFYKDFMEGQKVRAFIHNPYVDSRFLNEEGHCIQTWIEMFGMKYQGEQPELFIAQREKEYYLRNFASDKPVMAIQTNGGADGQDTAYSWARDIPVATAQAVVDAFKDEYNIIHIRRQNQPGLNNTMPLTASFREIATIIQLTTKRLFMDSFAQHTAAALNLPSTVCWIVNKPMQFGYMVHDNIVANPATVEPDLRQSYLNKYNIAGSPLEFPYASEAEIFNVDEIITSVKELTPLLPDLTPKG